MLLLLNCENNKDKKTSVFEEERKKEKFSLFKYFPFPPPEETTMFDLGTRAAYLIKSLVTPRKMHAAHPDSRLETEKTEGIIQAGHPV